MAYLLTPNGVRACWGVFWGGWRYPCVTPLPGMPSGTASERLFPVITAAEST
jgi:hypothetical protein